jgi:hypothetical protein
MTEYLPEEHLKVGEAPLAAARAVQAAAAAPKSTPLSQNFARMPP